MKSSPLKDAKFLTEVRVHDADLGISGTIDLLIEDANGFLHIFD